MQETLCVLYAEDDAADTDLTKAHFTRHAPEIQLEVVATGQACLETLQRSVYDVLLLDNHLPDMDGIDVLREVMQREIPVPVVMVTGVGDETLVVQVIRLGASDYVPKHGEYLTTLADVLTHAARQYRQRHALTPAAERRLRRILYVERHSADAELTQGHFAEFAGHFTMDVVHTSTEALAVLEQGGADAVLADLRLPDLNALELLGEARRRGLRVPFIVITGNGDEQAALAALKLGASDYIVKRENYLTQLPYAIENAISRALLEEANERLQLELRERQGAEAHVRRLNEELQNRVVQRTQQLEAAQQELEEAAILELIAQSAPLVEICGRIAAVLAQRSATVVTVATLPPTDPPHLGRKSEFGAATASTVRHEVAAHTTLSVATPDGVVYSTSSPVVTEQPFLDTLTNAERMPSHAEFPIQSSVTQRRLGYITLYRAAVAPSDSGVDRVIDRCTKLAAIAIHRAHSEDRIQRQALEDPLTGLPNRTLWFDRFEQALAAARRELSLVAVLLYDLDRFKDINDSFGHDVGDRVLRHVALQLGRSMRPTDTVGRLGGDEFAVVLPNLNHAREAERIAERGLAAVQEPVQVDNAVLRPKASVGIALHPSHGDNSLHLLRRADVAMYRAKRLGTRIATFEEQRDQEQLESLDFVAELERGILNDQLLLCYQPKIDLRSGRTSGVECLVRWQHPTRGLIRPLQLIPLAESTGLIKPLSMWVINRALQDYRTWCALGIEIPVAVNLAAPLLYDRDLLDTIRRGMVEFEIGYGHLEVEITESAVMLDPDEAMKTMTGLRESGVAFALDDFGTGYSSLAHLKNLPVQSIKIDQSFVRHIETDARDASIVRAAIELGHSFRLDIVAEGVESLAAREILDTMGCDHAQGFYFAQPMVSSEFLDWCGRT